jgi:nucleoside-diphosphate-sugar epimerase
VDKRNKTIFITGASGFVGRRIIDALCKDKSYKIYAVTTGRRKVSFPNEVLVLKADLSNNNEIQDIFDNSHPDILLHLAWDQNSSDFRNSESNYLWLEISLKLMRIFQQAGGEHLVFAGSSAQYDDNNGLRQEGNCPGNKKSIYGKCKYLFEDAASYFCTQNNVEFTSCRLFTVFGEGDTHLFGALPSAIQAFMQGNVFICKNPNAYRDYIHIDDVADAFMAVLRSDYNGAINVASGIPRRMEDVFRLIARIMQSEHLLQTTNKDIPGDILVADTAVLREIIHLSCSVNFEEAPVREIEYMRSL